MVNKLPRDRRSWQSLGTRGTYAAHSFAGQLTFATFAFLGSVLAARLLGADGKGEYTAWTLAGWLVAVIAAGPIPVGMGRIALDRFERPLLRMAIMHALLVSPPLALLTSVGILFGAPVLPLVAILLIAVPAGVVTQDMLVVMQATKRPWRFQAIRIVGAATVTMGTAGLTIIEPREPVPWALIVFAMGAATSAALAARLAPTAGENSAPPSLRELTSLGKGSTYANVIDLLLLRMDQLFVLVFAGPAGLGIYSVAVNWTEGGLYLGHSIGQSLFEDERTLDRQALRHVFSRAIWVLVLGMAALVAGGWFLITPLFGSAFDEARWVVLALAPGIVARGLGYSCSQVLLARGEGPFVSRVMLVSLLAGVLGWLALTALFGLVGAAVASSAVYLLQFLGLGRRADVQRDDSADH